MDSSKRCFKVAVIHRVGVSENDGDDLSNVKPRVWRFNPTFIDILTLTLRVVEDELIHYFPSILKKIPSVGISLCYKESFVGAIKLESDMDLQVRGLLVV